LNELIGEYLPYLIAGVGLVFFTLTIAILLLRRKKQNVLIPVSPSSASVFMNSVFNASPQSILIIDQSGQIIELNHALSVLTGYTNADLKAEPLSKIAPAFDVAILNQEIPSPISKEIEVTLKSGEKLPFLFFMSPFSSESKPYYTVMVRNPKDLNAVEANSRRALDVIQSRMDELTTIRRVSENLNQATTLRGAMAPVLETVRSITKSSAVWLLLPDDANILCQRVDYDPLQAEGSLIFTTSNSCSTKCVATLLTGELGTAQIVEQCDCAEHTLNVIRSSSHYALPLYLGKKPIGVLNFTEDPQHPITENKLELLHTICDSFSVALERVRLFITEHEQRKLAETLGDIGSKLTQSLDLSEVLDLLLDQLKRLVPYDGGNIMVIAEENAFIERIKGYLKASPEELAQLKALNFPLKSTPNLYAITKELKARIIPDTSKNTEWVPSNITHNYRSWLGAPVVVDGKTEVIFSLDKEEPDFYTSRHADLLTAFCSQAALAIKNARLYSRELRRIQELDGLQATLTGINSELDLNTLLRQLVTRAISLLNADLGELGLYERENNGLRVAVSENMDKNYQGLLVKMGEGLMGRVAESLQPMTIADYQHWNGSMEQYQGLMPHAVMAIPMVAGSELFGVIGIGDRNTNRRFSSDDIRLLESFAQQAIIAIQNARLFQDARKRADEAETLSRAGSLVAATLDQNEAIERILEQLAFVVPYDSASVLLRKEQDLVIVGGHGFKDENPVLGMSYSLDPSNPGALVYLQNKPIILNNVNIDFPTFNQIPQSEHLILSWLGAPLTIKGEPIGILSLDAHECDKFTQEHARLVTSFADQVSIALENARLYTEEVQSAARFKTLYEFGQTIGANLQLEDMYPLIFEAVKKLMKTEYFSIALIDRENALIRDVFIYDRDEPVELETRNIDKGLFGKVIKEGKPRLWHYFTREMVAETGAVLVGNDLEEEISQSIIIVPLKTGTGVIGVLSAQSYTPDMYSEVDMEALELLGANTAVAFENAQLFAKVQSMAITDYLTGLYNRRKFYEYATQEFERSRRYQRPLSVIMMDIDHFKRVNDTYGHAIGDQVLQGWAWVIKNNLRQVDILARYGGEEFVILLPETPIDEAIQTAERLRISASDATLPTRVGNMSVTISLGVVCLDESCRNLEELLDRSDQAMYASKRTGRNKVSKWIPEYSVKLPGTGPLPVIKPIQYI
jgi:diguanylate cyclase (GGDEF)-like protein/PAS domain S-box-containing protein